MTTNGQPTAAKEDAGAAATGADVSPQLSKTQLKKAEKNNAKMEKFLAKQAAKSTSATASDDKKEKKAKPAATDPAAEVFINDTPKGQKKDMSRPMADSYNPTAVEAAWYSWWEQSGYFKPKVNADGALPEEGVFVIPIPPPNVTGSLHLGHALTGSIQDSLTRWHRMQGKSALYVPGCDHAGIATQIVVEKKLQRERKITRHDLGREEFIEEVWKWKGQYGDRIYEQLRRIGSSVDWDRVRFTMDPMLAKAVNEAFVRLHDQGIIYRQNRLVNWCTKLKTALSNLEVITLDLKGRTMLSVPDHDPKQKYEFGVIISFAYNIEDSDEQIVVATTRLETMLGDTAVAVHPDDKRYKHLVGKKVIHPFLKRSIPIIADDYVLSDFGTGAVKITPAHDPNDYAMGKRHNLPFINIFTDEGKINENGGPFEGLQRFDARVAVLERLKELGLYKETKDNPMSLPYCERSGNIVEPVMKPQWWVNCKTMADASIQAVKDGKLTIIPEQSNREWFKWLENIQDWCISRQLWWGHRVPAYIAYKKGGSAEDIDGSDNSNWVCGRTEEEARARAAKKLGISEKDVVLEQVTQFEDPDVLDTWFSSGLWPFSIMGWPEKTNDMKLFYPNSMLETGWDILFFWVARMVMLGITLTGEVPFKTVFCHAMVRDAHGRKMSKSLGNVIDPLDVIEGIKLEFLQKRLEEGNLDPKEVQKAQDGQKKDFPNGIPQCGTDAMRFALLAYTSAGRDINLDILRVEGYRKFCNKLWNATRFALMKLTPPFTPLSAARATSPDRSTLSLAEKWILSRLNHAIGEQHSSLEAYNFMGATSAIYNFWLYELCDVYLEVSKNLIDSPSEEIRTSAQNTLYTCLDQGLKLLHPFMPFVTEELYQRLPRRPREREGEPGYTPSIMLTRWPIQREAWDYPEAEKEMATLNEAVHAVRSLLVDYNIKSGATIYVQTTSALSSLFQNQRDIISSLAKGVTAVNVLAKEDDIPAGCALYPVSEDVSVFLLVKGKVNFEEEIEKLEKKRAKAEKELATWKKKTEVPDYENKVRADVRESTEAKIKGFEAEVETISKAIQNFVSLRDS
ncbi:tRNA synthetases class I-domain-containing protein [Cladochytrium replicatum]|nr:tRNA synthetases class I-domain-containing protein [Cladochytrium replicatum]